MGFLLFLIEKRSFAIQKCVGVTREIRYTERADENVIKNLEWFFRYFWYSQKFQICKELFERSEHEIRDLHVLRYFCS